METRNLPCKLTDEELLTRGAELSAIIRQKELLAEEKTLANEGFKERQSEMDKRLAVLAEEIRTKHQSREVQVTRDKDWVRKEELVTRLDTSEVVEIRALTPAELQRPLPFPKDQDQDGETDNMTLQTPGHAPVKTNLRKMQKAADKLAAQNKAAEGQE